MIRRNSGCGVSAFRGTVLLRGGVISGNKTYGANACGGTVTVAKADETTPQTVCKGNGKQLRVTISTEHDPRASNWSTANRYVGGGEIIGIPQEKINV